MTQGQALRVLLEGESAFLTGPPGAGKTYVLNEFIRRARKMHKNVAVTASTGIAATHIGGTTIHSWSGLGIRDSLSEYDRHWLKGNDRLVKRYVGTDILVIDEISMLHGKRLDMVSEACKILRENDEPFGGLQVVLVGDLFQLPPVTRGSELLDFAHMSTAWAELDPKICYLTEQHRQQGDQLLDVLEAMRRGEIEEWHAAILTERLGKKPAADTPVTRLYAHNIDVETINQRHLTALDSDSRTFPMQMKGTAAKVEQLAKSVLAPEALELKVGAEVMFVANNFAEGFVNGSRGQVIGFKDSQPLVRLLANDRIIKVEPHSWTLMEDDKKRAEVVQLPLRLAWAITIHKSQGMSLDAAEIDLGKSFTPGMGYVALSRVRSLDGVFLTGMNAMAMQLHPDIFAFDAELRQASEALAAQTSEVTNEEEAEVAAETAISDEALLAELKHWRATRASTDGVPAYIVAHNKLLEEIARRPPISAQQLLATPGFGARKLEVYGDDLLEILAKHAPATAAPAEHLESQPVEPATSKMQPSATKVWTQMEDAQLLEIFRAGQPLKTVCLKLQRSSDDVWDRLSYLLDNS